MFQARFHSRFSLLTPARNMAGTKDDQAEGCYQPAPVNFHHHAAKTRAKFQDEKPSSRTFIPRESEALTSWTLIPRTEAKNEKEEPDGPCTSLSGSWISEPRKPLPEVRLVRPRGRRFKRIWLDWLRLRWDYWDSKRRLPPQLGRWRHRRRISRRTRAHCSSGAPFRGGAYGTELQKLPHRISQIIAQARDSNQEAPEGFSTTALQGLRDRIRSTALDTKGVRKLSLNCLFGVWNDN